MAILFPLPLLVALAPRESQGSSSEKSSQGGSALPKMLSNLLNMESTGFQSISEFISSFSGISPKKQPGSSVKTIQSLFLWEFSTIIKSSAFAFDFSTDAHTVGGASVVCKISSTTQLKLGILLLCVFNACESIMNLLFMSLTLIFIHRVHLQ